MTYPQPLIGRMLHTFCCTEAGADTLFQAGSRIRLSSVEHLRKEVYDENGQIVTITVPRFWKTREFIVQEHIETDTAADQPILYLDHALLEELLGVVERPGRAYLRLTDRTRSAELAAQLREKLPRSGLQHR